MKEFVILTLIDEKIQGYVDINEGCDIQDIPYFNELNDLGKAVAISAYAHNSYTIYINELHKYNMENIIKHERGHLRYLEHTMDFWRMIGHVPNQQIEDHNVLTKCPIYPELATPDLRREVEALCKDPMGRLKIELEAKECTSLNIINRLTKKGGKEGLN